jgi:hypothetical protein
MRRMGMLVMTAALACAQDEGVSLAEVKRVYVERLEGGETAGPMRELIIASLHSARLFVLTEDPARADAVLRGAAEDLIYVDQFQASEGVDMRVGLGAGTRSARAGANLAARALAVSIGDDESVNIRERKHEAMAAVRLVNRAGDVIWSTTQESAGGKFRGAGADVAEKIARRLAEDLARAKLEARR